MTDSYEHICYECYLDSEELSVTKEFYTIAEMAELLRIRPGTVRNRLWLRANSLPPSMMIGRRRLFPFAEYEAWKQRLLTGLRDS
jgi:excisionase family DNA binding protein